MKRAGGGKGSFRVAVPPPTAIRRLAGGKVRSLVILFALFSFREPIHRQKRNFLLIDNSTSIIPVQGRIFFFTITDILFGQNIIVKINENVGVINIKACFDASTIIVSYNKLGKLIPENKRRKKIGARKVAKENVLD